MTTSSSRVTEVPAEASRAVDASSFAKMREHEDRADLSRPDGAPRPRVMRAGKTQGWKDWMTAELADRFSGIELREVARRYGYDLDEVS